MQIGGKHYVSFDDSKREFSFKDKFDRPLLSLNYDIELRCILRDPSSIISPNVNYVGIIFWGKGYYQQMKNKDDMKGIYIIRNWIDQTINSRGGKIHTAFNTGTVIMMESSKLMKDGINNSNPHWKLWEHVFGKSHADFIVDNPSIFYLMTGFSWNQDAQQFIFRSGLANTTNNGKQLLVKRDLTRTNDYSHIKYDLVVSGDDNTVFGDLDKSEKDEITSIHKDEDPVLQKFLSKQLNKLIINNKSNPYELVSYKPPVKWYRVTPDHAKSVVISSEPGDINLITDKYIIWNLENGLTRQGDRLYCPEPMIHARKHNGKVYKSNILTKKTSPYLTNKYWTSELYHKSGVHPDNHVYYYDYHNMLQIDIWFEGTIHKEKLRMSYLAREPKFENGNDELQDILLKIIYNKRFYEKYLVYKTKYKLLQNKLNN